MKGAIAGLALLLFMSESADAQLFRRRTNNYASVSTTSRREYSSRLEEKYIECYNRSLEVKYVKDEPEGADNWQPPNVTKMIMQGDCEDLAFYLYDMLKKAGVESRVVIGYMKVQKKGHAWVEVIDKKKRTIILDPARRKIIDKAKYKEENPEGYTEFNNRYPFKTNINYFINRYENGDDSIFVARIPDPEKVQSDIMFFFSEALYAKEHMAYRLFLILEDKSNQNLFF